MIENLAYRMRPQKIEDVIGQTNLLGENKIIWRMVKAHRLSSMILYGPPGTGKTSIAKALSGSLELPFAYFNASVDDKKKLQKIAKDAKDNQVVMLLDEIHRLDKPKQDFLLPFLENGQIIVIGATTENPYININPAIRSRTQIFEVKPLSPTEIKQGVLNALADTTNGLGAYNVDLTDEALNLLTHATNGDLRSALNALEIAVLSTPADDDALKTIHVDLATIEETVQRKQIAGDKNGDAHYDVISAFQKSIRGSDTDAALHYAARILTTGDLNIICRRLLVIAYEDIGLANPDACAHTVSAVDAAFKVGLPEARIPLANAIIELATSPKSNRAINAIDAAANDLSQANLDIPADLKDAHYKGAATLNHGVNYKYAHDYPHDWVAQQYLPDALINKTYIDDRTNSTEEKAIITRYKQLKLAQKKGLNVHD